jgi:hypothetical protein
MQGNLKSLNAHKSLYIEFDKWAILVTFELSVSAESSSDLSGMAPSPFHHNFTSISPKKLSVCDIGDVTYRS